MKRFIYNASVVAIATTAAIGGSANAQSTAETPAVAAAPATASDGIEDIVVTARRRDETSLSTPVVVTAVSAEQLEQRGINTIDGLVKLVPNLVSGEGGGAQQGIVAIRGVSGSESNPIADQAVSFNIDGVQVARASVRRMATIDLAQIEVLKGPQALFFGKNSPAGVIAIKSAEPTNEFTGKLSGAFGILGQELVGEGFISGPVSSNAGFRVAFYGSDLAGFGHNRISPTSIYAPSDLNSGAAKEYALRGTFVVNPTDGIKAAFRANYSNLRTNGPFDNSQLIDCPSGRPQFGDPIACKADDETYFGSSGPVVGTLNKKIGNGDPFLKQNQGLYSLNLDADLSDTLKLTSITGLYKVSTRIVDNTVPTANPTFIRPAAIELDFTEKSQELRLLSDFSGPFNFLMGTHLSNSNAHSYTQTFSNAAAPVVGSSWDAIQKGKAWSVLAQVMLTPIERVEISGGGRYSRETKRLTRARSGPLLVDRTLVAPEMTWSNFSPEATIAFRPNDRTTVFASYKQGFLSGGFNAPSINAGADVRYDQQTVDGIEGGLKFLTADRNLRLDLTAYDYQLKGLQVSTSVNGVLTTTNAGAVSLKGVELVSTYATPLPGLKLNGAVAYTDGVFDQYTVACYRGQTRTMGCNFGTPNASGIFSLQDRSGQRMIRSPKWVANAGISYGTEFATGTKFSFSTDLSYTSSYDTDATGNPGGIQKGYALVDATAMIEDGSGDWEFALIGQNLTNRYYVTRTTAVTGSGTAPGGATGTRADTQGYVSRGREIKLRLTRRF
jgi:iron complex outermembrane receptor protein